MSARVCASLSFAPLLGNVEHVRKERQASVGIGGTVLSFRMESGDVRTCDIREASLCQLWPDVKSEIPPILLN